MRRHVERELARARAAQAGGAPRQAAPALVARQVVEVLRRTPRGQELAWTVEVPADLVVHADAQDLAEMLGNLAENAAKWAREGVRLAGACDEGKPGVVVLAVEDDGPGIAEDRTEEALARGGRLDTTKPGTGLGLAIVGDLAEAYGGALGLGRSERLGGLKAEIRLAGGRGSPGTA
nr:ATP-binding protein [Neoroseomonas soli]